MSSKIQVTLLGVPQVEGPEGVYKFPYKKTEGIFYYLCVKKQVSREELIQTFWGGSDEAAGRKSLRQVVYQLKKVLGEDLIQTTGHSLVALNPDLMPDVDWDLPDEELVTKEEEFLHFFYIKDCEEFDRWIEEMRQKQKERSGASLESELRKAVRRRDAKMVHHLLQTRIRWEPLSSEVILEAMNLYTRVGQYNLAIQTFYDYKKKLNEELGEEPEDDLVQLFYRTFQMKESSMNQTNFRDDYFYGRFEEIYDLDERIQRFQKNLSTKSALIVGDAGVGKTALLEYIYRMNQGGRTLNLFAHIYENDQNFYLRSWGEIFKQLEKYQDEGRIQLSTSYVQLIHQIVHGNSQVDSQNILMRINSSNYLMLENLLLNVFMELAKSWRIIIYIDDIQWIDQMSKQLMQRLIVELGNFQILLLATLRTTENMGMDELFHSLSCKGLVDTMELNPFSAEETREIAKARLQGNIDEPDYDEIFAKTEGNALFLMNILDMIREKGWRPGDIPAKTKHMIQIPLQALNAMQAQVLNAISVFMEFAELEELQVLIPMDQLELLEILEELQKKKLVKEMTVGSQLVYGFRHQIVRDFVYQQQSLGKLRLWHLKVAEFYENKRKTARWFEYLPFLVYQYNKGGEPEKAERYRVIYYCEFFALCNENFPILQRQMIYQGRVGDMSADEEEILTMAQNILNSPDYEDDLVHAECHYLLGRAQVTEGSYEKGLHNIGECIRILGKTNSAALLLGAYQQMIFYGIQVDDRKAMREYIEKGFDYLEGDKTSSYYGTFLRLKGFYYYREEQYAQAEEFLTEAIGVFRGLRNPECRYDLSIAACYNYLGKVAARRRDYQKAERWYQQAIETGNCEYVTNGMGQCYTNIGHLMVEQERWEEAEQYLLKGISCFSQNGFVWGRDRAECYLAMTYANMGRDAEAQEHLSLAENFVQKMKNPENIALLEKAYNMLK